MKPNRYTVALMAIICAVFAFGVWMGRASAASSHPSYPAVKGKPCRPDYFRQTLRATHVVKVKGKPRRVVYRYVGCVYRAPVVPTTVPIAAPVPTTQPAAPTSTSEPAPATTSTMPPAPPVVPVAPPSGGGGGGSAPIPTTSTTTTTTTSTTTTTQPDPYAASISDSHDSASCTAGTPDNTYTVTVTYTDNGTAENITSVTWYPEGGASDDGASSTLTGNTATIMAYGPGTFYAIVNQYSSDVATSSTLTLAGC